MVTQTILDRAIAWVSPKRGLARTQARAQMGAIAQARMAYDGASQGRRSQGWRVVSGDANGAIRAASNRLRDVAHDLVRNNPYAARAKHVIASNTIGGGIIPTVTLPNLDGPRRELERLLREHFDTTDCDAAGKHDLYGLEMLAMGTIVESGEVLIRNRPKRAGSGLALPFQLEVLEPDYLNTNIDGVQPNGSIAVQGVEYTRDGRPSYYHLFDEHPASTTTFAFPKSTRVPASLVAHVYRVDRPKQGRGVSWFAPVIPRMRDFADYSDAQLLRQKIAACFTAFRHGGSPADPALTPPSEQSASKYPIETLEPGMIMQLDMGEEITFGEPPSVEGFGDYTAVTLREIAAGMGVSYEALTGDLTRVNFASGRLGWLEFQRSIESWRNFMLLPQMLQPIGRWFLEAAALETGRRYPALIAWTAPRRDMIDPSKEVKASRDAIRSGLSSRSAEVKRLGVDPDVLDAEIAADNERADRLNLSFDSDPRRMTLSGANQVEPDEPQA